MSPAEQKHSAAIQRTEFFEDENAWVCLEGYLKAEIAGAWQMKARRILLYYGVEHDQEESVGEGMQVIVKNKRTKNVKI